MTKLEIISTAAFGAFALCVYLLYQVEKLRKKIKDHDSYINTQKIKEEIESKKKSI